LAADPGKSDRAIARVAKVDHKTVAAVRAEAEGRGEIPHVETCTDTKGRKQPAKKAAAKTKKPTRKEIGEQARKQRAAAWGNEDRAAKAFLAEMRERLSQEDFAWVIAGLGRVKGTALDWAIDDLIDAESATVETAVEQSAEARKQQNAADDYPEMPGFLART
jgi:hypothetical protein